MAFIKHLLYLKDATDHFVSINSQIAVESSVTTGKMTVWNFFEKKNLCKITYLDKTFSHIKHAGLEMYVDHEAIEIFWTSRGSH